MSEPIIDLDKIESLAKAAQAGPLAQARWWSAYALREDLAASCDTAAIDAEFIAAISPDVVLSLVEEVRKLRAERVPEHGVLLRAERERDAYKRAVERVAHMAATLRAESVTASPGVRQIAAKIAGEIEARLECAL